MRLSLIAVVVLTGLFVVAGSCAADPPLYPVKWSQPPVPDGTTYQGLPVYLGWDEISWFDGNPPYQKLADDFLCETMDPITDIHWWGSYLGWMEPSPYPVRPIGFQFEIYTDIPVGPGNPYNYSMPGTLVWQYQTNVYEEQLVGYDRDPFNGLLTDSTFQYNVYLPQDKWFYQEQPNTVYWLSIQAVYAGPPPNPNYGWGWKTRQHYYNDDAVNTTNTIPAYYPLEPGWDMAFELTPEPTSLLALGAGLMALAAAIKKKG